ncbi:MAG: Gfo/Idh/MocA family oxidoreductase [Hespellia sp.]|nr:Gfo/Idh/MocA family oxidoreductase [Hespellia sp.]
MEKMKWGLMGAGRISGWFATALSALDEAEIYAIASRQLEKGQAFAHQYGVTKAYGSYEEMLSDDAVDIVYIGTPIQEHFRCVKMCLEAGKHVLCEKALTENAEQAKQLCALAREKKLFLMEAMWTKCQPVFRQIKQWIADGLLGEIQAADIRFYTKAGEGHRLYKKELAGGALLDLGYYPVTYACDLLGYHPQQIQNHTIVGEKEVDYLDSIVLEYKGGRFAHLSCGLGAEKMVSMYLLGSKGRISMQEEFFFQAQRVEVLDFDNHVLASFAGTFIKNGYEYEALEVMKCLREGRTESEIVKLDDSIAVMEILDQCKA